MTDVGEIVIRAENVIELIKLLSADEKVEVINQIKLALHEASPFKNEPVDCVLWVKGDQVYANDYNPNSVATPEMELLSLSILADGYTQPIVTWPTDQGAQVIDGFHRNRVGKENKDVNARIMGYLPVVSIRSDREDQNDRMASTIRHNRARGKHKIEAMSEIVLALKRRNWSPKKIGKELGMDQDEVLRLVQISGLSDMFKDSEFSEAWEVDAENLSPVVDVGGSELQDVGPGERPAELLGEGH